PSWGWLPPPSPFHAIRPPPAPSWVPPSPEQPRNPGFTRLKLRRGAVQTTIRPQPCLTLVATAARLPPPASTVPRPGPETPAGGPPAGRARASGGAAGAWNKIVAPGLEVVSRAGLPSSLKAEA